MNGPGTFYEFFAGAGMARAGLGDRWRCLFANDFDHKKAATYRRNWSAEHLSQSRPRSTWLPSSIGWLWACRRRKSPVRWGSHAEPSTTQDLT